MLTLIRGAGDLASGIALRLHRSGLQVVMTELPGPLSIRRTVAFSEAVVNGEATVEGVRARRAETAAGAMEIVRSGEIAVLIDPALAESRKLHADVLVDAILAKRNIGTKADDAPVVIGVGPGFTAGEDCHAVVETMRGHTLGRAIYCGSALPNTNIPGLIGGYAGERVLRAPKDGAFRACRCIGDTVQEDEVVGYVDGAAVRSTLSGVLRGMIADDTRVSEGLKIGDVDPRGVREYCFTASDKALAIGGGVLEAILYLTHPFK